MNRAFIVLNADASSKHAEIPDEHGTYPSEHYLKKHFDAEISSGLVEIVMAHTWGSNAGSAQALTLGARIARASGHEYLLNWSPELKISHSDVCNAIEIIDQHAHSVVGFLRRHWWSKMQWGVVQNTGCIWKLRELEAVGYFDSFCDNVTKEVDIEEFGLTPLMGMEDFHSMLKMDRDDPDFTWGMVNSSNPIRWNVVSTSANRLKSNKQKIARQEQVIRYYIESLIGLKGIAADDFLDEFMSKRTIYK